MPYSPDTLPKTYSLDLIPTTWAEYVEKLMQGTSAIKAERDTVPAAAKRDLIEALRKALIGIRLHLIRQVEKATKDRPANSKIYEALLDKTNQVIIDQVLNKFNAILEKQKPKDTIRNNLLGALLDILGEIPFTEINGFNLLDRKIIDVLAHIIAFEKALNNTRPSPIPAFPAFIPHQAHLPTNAPTGILAPIKKIPDQTSPTASPTRSSIGKIVLLTTGLAVAAITRRQSPGPEPLIESPYPQNIRTSPRPHATSIPIPTPDHGIYAHAKAMTTWQLPGHDSIARPTLVKFLTDNPTLAQSCIPIHFSTTNQWADALNIASTPTARQQQTRLHALFREAHNAQRPVTMMWTADCKEFRFVIGDVSTSREQGAIAGQIVLNVP